MVEHDTLREDLLNAVTDAASEPSRAGKAEQDEPHSPLVCRLLPRDGVNYAMARSEISMVGLTLQNKTDEAIRDVTFSVVLHADGVETEIGCASGVLPVIESNAGIAARIRLPLDTAALVQMDEATSGRFQAVISIGGVEAIRSMSSTRILAYNECHVRPGLYELVAAHVLPNHPAIVPVLQEAGRILQRNTGNSDIDGYQSGGERAVQIGQAIYEALRLSKIGYINPPGSFEEVGQKIRTPDQVVGDKLGTCLDLACLYAACLEQAGLHPLMHLKSGHAFAGFWSDGDKSLPEACAMEPDRSLTIHDNGLAVAVETTGFTAGKDCSFEEAAASGRTGIPSDDDQYGLVDIRRARLGGVLPLPSRVRTKDGVTIITQQIDAQMVTAQPAYKPLVPRNTQPDRTPERMRGWKAALLDLTLRNPLLQLKTGKRAVNIVVPPTAIGRVEDMLMQGQALKLVAHDEITELQRQQGARTAAHLAAQQLDEHLQQHNAIFMESDAAVLRRRCKTLMDQARAAEEENGTNILHLTLGSLHWMDPKSGKPVRSPVLLLPVRLRAAGRGKPMELIADPAGGTVQNHCLLHKLKLMFNLHVPELEQLEDDGTGIAVEKALNGLRTAIIDSGLSMRVDDDASIALLQFGKFRMWKDLEDHWERFLDHRVIRHLVEKPGESFVDDVVLPAPQALDRTEVFCPISCDGAQLEAIVSAAAGSSFVLEGPPGTGKSQTITNLIANAMASGKRVLFVAEKRAALNVVKRRLEAVGLGPFCLDIHGKDSNPKQLREQLSASLDSQVSFDKQSWQEQRDDLGVHAGRLREYAAALHAKGPLGLSAWECRESLLKLGEGPQIAVAGDVPPDRIRDVTRALRDLQDHAAACGPLTKHPWRFLRQSRASEQLDRESLRRAIGGIRSGVAAMALEAPETRALVASSRTVSELRRSGALVAAVERLPRERRTVDVTARASAAGAREKRRSVVSALSRLLSEAATVRSVFSDEVFTLNCRSLADDIDTALKSFFLFRSGRVRKSMEPITRLARGAPLTAARTAQRLRETVPLERDAAALGARAQQALFPMLRAEWTPWADDAEREVADAASLLDGIADALSSDQSSAAITAWLSAGAPSTNATATISSLAASWASLLEQLGSSETQWLASVGDRTLQDIFAMFGEAWDADGNSGSFLALRRWCTMLRTLDRISNAGFQGLTEPVLEMTLSPRDAQQAFARGVMRAGLDDRLAQDALASFDGLEQNRTVRYFLDLQEADARLLRTVIPARLLASRPFKHGQRFGEIAELVRKELSRTRGGLGIRGMLKQYARAINQLTPCFLMSPDSVAQFLEPGLLEFDIVVFDEASQVPVGDAIGAIARGKSLVVVGDSRQMPPTSFFGGSGTDDDAPDAALSLSFTEDLESILSECVGSGLPRLWLSWHYRSQEESLIAFSNAHYYEGRLSSFPPPAQVAAGAGVRWRHVADGVFDRGATRTNRKEAEAVVAEIERLLLDPVTASASIGVVTFNIEQMELIEALLEARGQSNAALDAAVRDEDPEQRLFVKNLESVQGDERDIILMCVCFGRDKAGRMTMNFGPLNRSGGERRWNVAVTRAKRQVVIFSSITPEEINVDRVGIEAKGVRHLRAYIEMARDGVRSMGVLSQLPVAATTGDAHRTAIAEALRAAGLHVACDLGLSAFRVDMAISMPDEPQFHLVAVLLDGPGYAARRTVQDRDGLPSQVLQGLMRWPATFRIWMPEWLAEPQRVVERLLEFVGETRMALTSRNSPSPASEAGPSAFTTDAANASVQRIADLQETTMRRMVAGSGGVNAPAVVPGAARTTPAHRDAEDTDFIGYVSSHDIGTKEDLDDSRSRTRALVQNAIAEVVQAEAPVECARLARAVARRFGLARVQQTRLDQVLLALPKHEIRRSAFGEFVWGKSANPDDWKGFRRTPAGADRPLTEIAPEEIRNAMVYCATRGMSVSEEGIIMEVAEIFDILRVTAQIRERLLNVLRWAVARGDLRRDGPRYIAG